MPTIHGNLVLEKDTSYDESLIVEGSIIGELEKAAYESNDFYMATDVSTYHDLKKKYGIDCAKVKTWM